MREDKYRTGLKRFWAAIIDWLIFWGPLSLYMKFRVFGRIHVTQDASGSHVVDGDLTALDQELFIVTICWTILAVIYPVFCHYRFGYTIGKWVVRVEVMEVSETRKLTLLQALFRDIVPVAVMVVSLVALLIASETFDQFRQYTSLVGFCWWLLEIISMLTNPKRRGIHDFLARSIVLRMPEDKTRLSKVVYHS